MHELLLIFLRYSGMKVNYIDGETVINVSKDLCYSYSILEVRICPSL